MKNKSIVILFFAIIFTSTLLRASIVAIGPISDIIISDLGISATEFGLITTIPLLVFAISSILIPFIASKNGLINSLIAGLILMMLGSVLRSISNYHILLVGTILLGFGISMGNVLIPAIIKEYAGDKRPIFTSVYLCMQNIFASIASGIAIYVTLKISWSFLMVCWIVPAGVALIFWLWFKKDRVDNSKKMESTLAWPVIKKLLKSPYAWSISLIMGMQSILYYTNVSWLPTIVSDAGFSESYVSMMMILFQLVALPGLFIIPLLVKRIKNNSLIVLLSSICIILSAILLYYTKNVALIFIAVLLVSAGAGNCFAWVVAIITEKTANSQQASSLSAMSQSLGYLMAASGPWLGGLLVDYTNNSHMILIFILIIGVIITLISIYIYFKRNKLSFKN